MPKLRESLLVPLCLCLLFIAADQEVNAAPVGTTSVTHAEGSQYKGGGYAGVAEFGSNWVLASLQGDIRTYAAAEATLEYTYDIAQGTEVSLIYSLMVEACTIDIDSWRADISSYAGVNVPGVYSDSVKREYKTNVTANQCFWPNPGIAQVIDKEANFTWTGSGPMPVSIFASVIGDGWPIIGWKSPRFFSGAAYADPEVWVDGELLNPIEPLAEFARLTEGYGEFTYTGPPSPVDLDPPGTAAGITSPHVVPEPSTLLLMGLVLAGLAYRRRRLAA